MRTCVLNKGGDVPIIIVEGDILPRVWEESLRKLWKYGTKARTEYDRGDEAPSRDCTMLMIVETPMEEPMLHLILPTMGWETLEKYRLEVIEGKNPRDGSEGESYTYHQRLFGYMGGKTLFNQINQIEFIVHKLAQAPYSRRAQAVTWDPELDTATDYPPCLQRIWCRVMLDSQGVPRLHMETNWRSRDAFGAAFPNMLVMVKLQELIVEKLSERLGEEILIGSYVDFSSSYHIYSRVIDSPGGSFKGFLKQIEIRPPEERFVRSDSKDVQDIFAEVRARFV